MTEPIASTASPGRREDDRKTCILVEKINERLDANDKRLNDGDARMSRIESKLDANNADTAEVLDILRLGKSFFRIVGGLGALVKWGAAIAAPVIAVIYAIKSGGKP